MTTKGLEWTHPKMLQLATLSFSYRNMMIKSKTWDDSEDPGEVHTIFSVFYSCLYYTASEGAGNLLGVSRCKSPHELWLLNSSGMEQALTNLTFSPAWPRWMAGLVLTLITVLLPPPKPYPGIVLHTPRGPDGILGQRQCRHPNLKMFYGTYFNSYAIFKRLLRTYF